MLAMTAYLELVKRDPGHEQAMFELTQYALRTPGLDDLPAEQYARYHALAIELLDAATAQHHPDWSSAHARPRPPAGELHRRTHPGLARRPRRRGRRSGHRLGRRRDRRFRRAHYDGDGRRCTRDRHRRGRRARRDPRRLRRTHQARHRRLDRRLRRRLARHLDGAARALPAGASACRSTRPQIHSEHWQDVGRRLRHHLGHRGPLRAHRVPAHRRAQRPHHLALRPPPPVDPRRHPPVRRRPGRPRSADRTGRVRRLLVARHHRLLRAHLLADRDHLRPGAGAAARVRLQLDLGAPGDRHHPRHRAGHHRDHRPGVRLPRARAAAARARAAVPAAGTGCACSRSRSVRRFTLKAIVQGMWISPRKHPDFGWTLLSRILVNVGNALGTGAAVLLPRVRPAHVGRRRRTPRC